MNFKFLISKIFLLLFLSVCVGRTFAQSRSAIELKDWTFAKDPEGKISATDNGGQKFTAVTIPHTWNAKDVMDDAPGYYRNAAWYKRKLNINPAWKGKKLFLVFDGAGQEAEVYINGKIAGSHAGSYTRFIIPVSDYLNFGAGSSNSVAVKLNNRFNENIPPLTADFTFFGGLYRKVSLLAVDPVHFDGIDFGSDGLFISTPEVSKTSARIHIKGNLVNSTARPQDLKILSVISDRGGRQVGISESAISIKANETNSIEQDIPAISKPNLWSPDHPYLYSVLTRIIDPASGRVLDELSHSVGFRWFSFDAEKGFFLNGEPLKLIGTSRHQDYKGMGNAVPEALQKKDVQFLKDMGANFLRVAHYPQDQVILDACDRLGILASIEIPVVNEITETDEFTNNCLHMQTEMIHQNYNHTSVIIWGYMNEVMLRPHFGNDKPKQEAYFVNIVKLAQKLEELTRREDPSRYTMIANHGSFDLYTRTGLTKVPMLVGWNLYQGWYSGRIEEFGPYLDMVHQKQPDKPFIVTEYGSDADDRIHSFNPEKFDKSVEYTNLYHQGYIKDIMRRSFVAGAAVWNLADFNSETREETMPHINNKGLLTIDRKPKNPYYLYQAALLKKPYIKIGAGTWHVRGGVADQGDMSTSQPLQVFSNTDMVELVVNGKSLGKKAVKDHVSDWIVPFINGKNTIHAVSLSNGAKVEDNTEIDFKLQPYDLKSTRLLFQQINILAGAKRYVTDETNHLVWMPDQVYRAGSWGHIGGEPFKITASGRQPYGTDKNIANTDDDPIYQTQLTGIEGYKLDVPNGKYELTLYFAELAGTSAQALAYNLSNSATKNDAEQRVFDIYLNDKLLIADFNISAQYGNATAVSKKFVCQVVKGQGISLTFKAKTGKAVLNAIQVKKI